ANGWIDERGTVLESMLAFKRAGADAVLSYFSERVAGWIGKGA
ncbi:MAG: porphobilinogen synthase, partial [Gammaproteobacteria bacterium]|nr:porphobilinogen synthase [Gammaproteobacteria bacterium]